MSVGRFENSINPLHLVMPDRVVVPAPTNRQVIPAKKPFEAGPGVVPFHRMLEAENLIPKAQSEQSNRIESNRNDDQYECSQIAPYKPVGLLPTLGEVLPIAPKAPPASQVQTSQQVHQPATGRLLDLYI